jgi:hypothetical protein
VPIGCVGDLVEFNIDGYCLNVENIMGAMGSVEPLNF